MGPGSLLATLLKNDYNVDRNIHIVDTAVPR